MATDALIDRLVNLTFKDYAIRTNIIGVGEIGQGQEELAPPLVMMQSPEPKPSEAVLELIRRGAPAVPNLVAHLGDSRPTKVPIPKMMGEWFGYEYDYNPRTTQVAPGTNRSPTGLSPDTQPASPRPATYAVGDICFDLLGQIVNRHFKAVRYQPTLCIVINCPSVLPEVRDAATKEWGNLTPELHRQRLMADVANPDYPERAQSASALLARYYPDASSQPETAH